MADEDVPQIQINGDPTGGDHVSREVKAIAAGEALPLSPNDKEGITPSMSRKPGALGIRYSDEEVRARFNLITSGIDEGLPHNEIARNFSEKYGISVRQSIKWMNRWYTYAEQQSAVTFKPGRVYARILRHYEKMFSQAVKDKDYDLQIKVMDKQMAMAGWGPAASRFNKGRPRAATQQGAKTSKDVSREIMRKGGEGIEKLIGEMKQQAEEK